MSADNFNKQRVKSRFVFEIRYAPLVKSFDQRGKVLGKMFEAFKSKMPHWQVSNVEVNVADDLQTPMKAIFIDHMIARMIYENPSTLQEFKDDWEKMLSKFQDIYPIAQGDLSITRIGFRFINVYKIPEAKSFGDIAKRVEDKFLNPNLPISLALKDMQLILKHESGQISFGPVKDKEPWLSQHFKDTSLECKFGLGLDIDSSIVTPEIKRDEDFLSVCTKVFELSVETENEMLAAFMDGANG